MFECLGKGGDNKAAILASMGLEQRRLVCFPLNDNESVAAGGSHWSLLVYVTSANAFE